ncbi:MAG TPA: hypothetical protein VGL22_20810 [Terracidiphilus sp.]
MKLSDTKILLAVLAAALCVSASSRGDSKQTPRPATHAPATASTGAQPNPLPAPAGDFSGLTFSEEQKARLQKIHEQGQSRLSTVANDPKLDGSQKSAMLEGYQRLEYSQMYEILTPEQKAVVRKNMAARHEKERHHQPNQQPPHPARP